MESVTFYAFSTENWKRPYEEVGAIMKLFGEFLIKAFDYEKENNRVVFLGDRSALEPKHQKLMNEIESDYDGVVEAILVKDGETVEYGQPLFRIH